MANKRGGYRAAKNYDPSAGKPSGKRRATKGGQSAPKRADGVAGGGGRSKSGASGAGYAKPSSSSSGHSKSARSGAGRSGSGRSEQPRPRTKPQPRDERVTSNSEHAAPKPRPRRERAGQGSNGLIDASTQLPAGEEPTRKPREDRVLERLDAKVTTAADAEGVSFADLGLDPRLVDALAELGAHEPFPIQVATIPDALGGKHVLGRGRTGSGKTIAFGAALVQRLFWMHGKRKKGVGRPPLALILVPTRELALQLDRTIQPLARALGMFTTQIYGGVAYTKQNTSLKRGVDIVIGTPGRVEDLERRGNLDLSQVAVTVLDEADEMSSMGFIDSVERILDRTKPTGQRMLFSATLDAAVLDLVAGYMPNPSVHELDEDAVGEIEHRVLIVERRDREPVLAQLAGSGGRVLIFRRMRAGAEELAIALREHGVDAVALHGDLSQPERTANLEQFTNGRVNVLVATDVAARGIHVDDVRLVVQADPPDEYKTYLHRAGRTGRAGNRGIVVTLVQPGRQRRMTELLERAEIDAPMIPASPGSASLDEFAE
ncbi:DEAD/DEAH box helicase [Gulosibacter molinativorax]|uniref:ATP-dependent helicase n=1 Tax=Gulosibacter molinativorax TaxID=256821 RepID=A0ABT7C8F7_9MICO|nr:DEAD/DEAH box helicase [Gulosibacter molinativorax]MDJ1371370.1 hypothetical protein [Gulosibacter molinativorax]QUY62867.1 ATP-dependent RNA helicase RhlE [Gulosibacter molinativorax]